MGHGTQDHLEQLLTAADLAGILRVPVRTVYSLHDQGVLPPALRLGTRLLRWPRQEITGWIENGPRGVEP